jgi:hypothetical protein
MQTYARWSVLNTCVKEEHPAGISLINLPQDDVIFQGLSKYYSKTFLILTDKEKKTFISYIEKFCKF